MIGIKEILKKVTEDQIFQAVFPDTIVTGKFYINPWRKDDSHGTCYFQTGTRLYLVDHAAKQKNDKYIDCFRAWELHHGKSFLHCLALINDYFSLNLGSPTEFLPENEKIIIVKKELIKRVEKKKVDITDRITGSCQSFSVADLKYFAQAGIRGKDLERYDVKCGKFIFYDNKLQKEGTDINPIYIYNENKIPYQIYRPRDKNAKFLTSFSVMHGIQQLENFTSKNVLVITKSMKDLLVFASLHFPAIGVMSESGWHAILQKYWYIISTYKHIILWFDNDETGKNNTNIICKEYQGKIVPAKYKSFNVSGNDPYEIASLHGTDIIEKIIYASKNSF